jgi:diguanylate cyclase (GGDEF)-like protein/PAS domain S-box-containing protein
VVADTTAVPILVRGKTVGINVIVKDVTQESQLRSELRRQLDFTDAITNSLGEGVCATNKNGYITFMNPAASAMLDSTAADLIGRQLHDVVHASQEACPTDCPIRAGASGVVIQDDEFITRHGRRFPVSYVLSPISEGRGMSGAVLAFGDVTERKIFEQELARRASHDPLTGIANRELFLERLDQALSSAARDDRHPAVLFMDLDNFKTINDTLGHVSGDDLLVEVANRLTGCLRPDDTVGRLGGDEFGVLLSDISQPIHATRTAKRILAALEPPICLDGREVRIRASIGVALGKKGARADEVLGDADIAMYAAKKRGRGQYKIFRAHMRSSVGQMLELENELRRAIEGEELVVHYQPIVTLRDGETVGTEALVRWLHPERGLLLPGEFIPLAEEAGLIVPLGQWVLETVCHQAHQWRSHNSSMTVAVNVSAHQLADGRLVDDVVGALGRSGLDPHGLVLELTESTLMAETEANARWLRKLSDLGVRLAIDDFGTGYASLLYLRDFPVEILKIDRSFVAGITEQDGESSLACAVARVGSVLGLDVIAEGVESGTQAASLLRLGCQFGQGSYFGAPTDASDLTRFPGAGAGVEAAALRS